MKPPHTNSPAANAFDWSIVRDPSFHRKLGILNDALRDDAIQDAYVKLVRSGRPVTLPLLLKAVKNACMDRLKSDKNRSARELRRAGFVAPTANGPNEQSIASVQPMAHDPKPLSYSADPAERMVKREKRRAIKRAIRAARLSRDHRCALWAWVRGRLTEFAERRGVKQVTARVWAKRARDAIKSHLEREGLGGETGP